MQFTSGLRDESVQWTQKPIYDCEGKARLSNVKSATADVSNVCKGIQKEKEREKERERERIRKGPGSKLAQSTQLI